MNLNPIVRAVKYSDRKNYLLVYIDPRSGKRVSRSAKTANRREAEREAARWEAELQEGIHATSNNMSWEAFRERYERQVSQEQAPKTLQKVISVFNSIEAICRPRQLGDLSDLRLAYYKDELLRTSSVNTAVSYLAHMRAALNAAVEWGVISHAPKLPRIKRGKGFKLMRGRAVTDAEFQKMLAATPSVVGDAAAESWQFLLKGLWWSGLRLQEACELFWAGYRGHVIDMDGKWPMFMIRGELEKGRRDRRLPMAPEFAELLKSVPSELQKARVFEPQARREDAPTPQPHRVGEIIAKIGQAAEIVVDADARTGNPTKFASAHDLRRAFGYRWARRVMPAILQKLMRHASVQTTMQYYVNLEADDVADTVWATISNTSSNSGQSENLAGQDCWP
ncbi:tyrosine-type recombinase/integrase [Lacipirellula parvula]|uniref:Tyr recombinase domain-containing protein n=1 Tax=Lacipirellula parvula TaxID=2650471 RepID=A0A5K7X9R2_9BACT|nr:site-specific integrase [Lacipirellula parvula]BBO33460.1 hypothetical protein PLANPX_3072 [Lacipirellula parvula]